jgi:hypothetical protein
MPWDTKNVRNWRGINETPSGEIRKPETGLRFRLGRPTVTAATRRIQGPDLNPLEEYQHV